MSAYVYSSKKSLEQDLALFVRLGFEDGGVSHIRAELERRDRGLSVPERLAEEKAACEKARSRH
jgi:hypothetical protein